MKLFIIVFSIIIGIILLILLISYIIYRKAFYNNLKYSYVVYEPLHGKDYEEYAEESKKLIKEAFSYKADEEVTIQSFDGITLYGKIFITDKNAPFQIQFHGYKGSGERDFSGGLGLALSNNFNVLLIDQRGHGKSDGRTITFGIKERKDVVSWVDFLNIKYNNPKIVLVGISMGAATVLMASSYHFGENVKGIIADCPYSSPKEIILKTSKEMGFPDFFSLPFLTLGALIYGHFNLNETTAVNEVKKSNLPILIIHGTGDHFVPCEMSVKIKEAKPDVRLVLVDGAPHGLSYMKDNEKYKSSVLNFINEIIE